MEVKYPASTEQFLSGGGELGELIRSTDWSKTALGPVNTWPQSLRTCVRIILTSRQPMFVWWGPQLINIYNDAYKAIVGGKHPEALGQPASVVWREIWDQVGPRADTVMNNNEGTYDEALLLVMERNGYPEETYYTFSYSPVPGDTGDTAGIICANTDDTDRIIGERQLRTLKDLGKNIADVQTEAEVYCRAMQVLKENPQDFPFMLLYRIDKDGETATLTDSSETNPDDNFAPKKISLTAADEIWPISKAVREDTIITIGDVVKRIGTLPSGAWEHAPEKALVLPISQSSSKHPYAVLVIGLNPYRLLDDKYLSFFQLVADQIATSLGSVHALEEERKRAEALAEIDKAKTAFFSNVSHEFRTPLTLMLGPLEDLLQNNAELPNEFTESISATHRNAMRLLKLVNTLLDFSRIEAGRIQAQYRPIDLAAFTRDLASSFRSIIEKAGLQYEVSCTEIKQEAYADQEMWEKIVLNLLSNAFKYTLEGSIKVSLKESGNNVVLIVEDTGVGIPEEELPRMFERFHRVPNLVGRTHEGTGIGLSLVNELVKLHGGTIEVASEKDKGSIFTITLPTGKEHLPAEHIVEASKHTLHSIYSGAFIKEAESLLAGHSATIAQEVYDGDEVLYSGDLHTNGLDKEADILVVDDNADMRQYLHRLLEGSFHVRTAEHGKAALETIQLKKPDLILSDIMMPVMDGKELLKELKGTLHTARIPVILLSARAGEEARIDGLDAGADDYVVKPFSAKELLSKIKSQIAIARTRYQAEEQLRNLFIQAPVAIVLFRGPDYIVELANEKYLEIVQRDQEFIGKPFFELLPELVTQGVKDWFDGVYATGEPFYGNERGFDLVRKNGEVEHCYFNFVYQPVREKDGSISGIVVAANEVTQQVIARRKIEESEQRLDMALESSQVGVWDLDIINKTLIRSPRYIEIVGYEEEYRPGYGLTKFVFPADKAYVEQAYHEAFMTGKLNMQFRLIRPDGSVRWLDSRGKVYFSEKNEPIRMIGTIADITERKETERQKDEFMSIVSHELKTPVTSLKAFGQVLQSRFLKEGDERSATLLGKMDTQINKLTTLIRDLLDDTKIQHGKLQFHEEAFNMDTLVEEIIEEIQRTTNKHKIIKENTASIEVFGDRERVGQILTNLIGNAIKYSPEADKIIVRSEVKNDEIICSVQDFGIGVPAELQDKVFDRFFRAYGEKHTTFPGLGLGLHISSEIIKRLGGEIWMESQEGQGSTFHFSLPLYRN